VSGGWTPGPWKVFRVESGPNRGKLLGIGDAQAGGVTDAFGGLWRSGKEMDANACLIAAAPTMRDYIAKRAAQGDAEALSILEAIDGIS
jgi:hypothetical protein